MFFCLEKSDSDFARQALGVSVITILKWPKIDCEFCNEKQCNENLKAEICLLKKGVTSPGMVRGLVLFSSSNLYCATEIVWT